MYTKDSIDFTTDIVKTFTNFGLEWEVQFILTIKQGALQEIADFHSNNQEIALNIMYISGKL